MSVKYIQEVTKFQICTDKQLQTIKICYSMLIIWVMCMMSENKSHCLVHGSRFSRRLSSERVSITDLFVGICWCRQNKERRAKSCMHACMNHVASCCECTTLLLLRQKTPVCRFWNMLHARSYEIACINEIAMAQLKYISHTI